MFLRTWYYNDVTAIWNIYAFIEWKNEWMNEWVNGNTECGVY